MASIQNDVRPATFSAVIIGAGITGLAAAYRLQQLFENSQQQLKLTVLEASDRAGGVIETTRNEFALIEQGPESFVTHKPAAMELAVELGLADRFVACSKQSGKTFICTDGKLHPLPEGFIMFAPTRLAPLAVSPMFSLGGKMRMALDLVLPPRGEDGDESLAEFVRRRLGKEALERLAEPLIAGIYSTDAERLSAECAVPRLREMEQKYGSVIRGLMNAPRPKATGPVGTSPFITFDKGMQVMIDALVARLPQDSLHYSKKVTTIKNGLQCRWRAICSDGDQIEADAVIIAVPAGIASKFLSEISPVASQGLSEIETGASAILTLIFRREDVGAELNASGFVVPAREGRAISACSFSSTKFGGRTQKGYVLMRAFTRKPIDRTEESWGELLKDVLVDDLTQLLDLKAQPVFWSVSPPSRIPRYVVGHRNRVERIMHSVEKFPGLYLAGNSYNGVGIPDCINSANEAALKVFELKQ